MVQFTQLLMTGIAIGTVYGIIALGLVLIYKSSGVLNVAQGEILMLGAFVCYFFSEQLGLPFYLAFILTIGFAIILGIVIERVLLRPMIGQPLLGVILMTIGLMLILKSIATMIWGSLPLAYPRYLPENMIRFGGVALAPDYLYGTLISLGLFVVFMLYFRYTRSGIAMRAVADDQTAAQSMGVNISRVFSTAWAFSCLVAAVGGIVLGTITSVSLEMSTNGLKAWPAVIIGGMESVPGSILGGLLIGMLEGLAGGYLDPYLSGIKDVFPFFLLLIILFIRPYGLFGLKRIERI